MAARSSRASGNTLANGAANYFVLHKNPIALTENVSMTFIGLLNHCARCHNPARRSGPSATTTRWRTIFSRVGVRTASIRGDVIVYPAAPGRSPIHA